ncbi:MAG: serine/threonine protein kinase [Steroidobacteraceae bacterium]|nr:serine/threonine protein kinase [Steroidobacteraceae bacterium]
MTNQNQAGTKLCGRFVLIEKLGAGGYGEVWRARDEMRDSEIALKILYSQFLNSEPAWQVFQREFTLTARLNHPGVLRVFEPVRAADAIVLPMVYAAGGDLRQLRGASYTRILPLLIDIAAALEHAHGRRIVHRDLKPSNVLLDAAGRPLLADFGAGASEGDSSSGPPGSPFSASPQQLAGEPARPADDIYGLGALAYELLSGYPPFYPAFDAKKIATEPVPRIKPVKPIPPRLELLISWLLAKQGRERPPSMRHVADEMSAVLQDTLGLEGSVEGAPNESEAAILGAAADNLTPVIMAEGDLPAVSSVRELEEIAPDVLPRVDEIRAAAERQHRASARRRNWLIAAVLIVATAGVAFLLPKLTSYTTVDPAVLQIPGGPTPAEVDAEKKAEELVDMHEELSKRLLELDSRAAAQWGGEQFAAARKSLDEIGGMLERRKFENAPAPLAQLQTALDEIEARVPQALKAQIDEGKRSLAAGELENARHAFDTALRIEPGNNEAIEWGARVAAASGVLPTIADAENAEAAKDLPKAKQLFTEVLKGNPGNLAATQGLARVNRALNETEFNQQMGAGLSALNAGRLGEANTYLQRAKALRPDSAEVSAALQRVADTGSGRSLADLENRAARLAAEERWTEALEVYDQALSRDPTLQFAINGKAAVAPRAELGEQLQALIDRPERLAADEVRRQAERLLAQAEALPTRGPVIRSQVSRLELLLPTFNQPVMLALESDNATEVAIQRVGFLGTFDRRQVELKPGRYTVTGKRAGFRDVRRDITVAPGQSGQTIEIRCLEPI